MTLSAGSFLYGFVRKDAAVSSEVKGTLATLQDVVTNIATRQAERPTTCARSATMSMR
ncbi:MAG: hypothetical protein IPM33_10720 [Phycisphaerales bacterium]|nr:hypothetical protein [Phycisphaerales bacterium]